MNQESEWQSTDSGLLANRLWLIKGAGTWSTVRGNSEGKRSSGELIAFLRTTYSKHNNGPCYAKENGKTYQEIRLPKKGTPK